MGIILSLIGASVLDDLPESSCRITIALHLKVYQTTVDIRNIAIGMHRRSIESVQSAARH